MDKLLKTVFVLVPFLLTTFAASAQEPKEQKAVADTSLLNSLKQYPKKNTLPVRQPVMQIQPVQIPVSELNLKVDYWKRWITFGINLNQAAFSNNWSGGGVNSIALGSLFNYKTDYTRGDKNYVSEVILQYGKLKNKNQLERKTNDRVFWDNKVALKLSKNWYFFGSLNFESQFDAGYAYSKDKSGQEVRTRISEFMAPGYLTESLGFEFKPNKTFFLRIGTGTARQTFVLDTSLYRAIPKNYGVKPGGRFRNELAFQVVSSVDKNLNENLNIKSRYTLFANYEKLNNIDQRLDVTFTSRITRLVNVTLSGIAIYDDDASNRIQASQALALGLVYKFPK
ncbi:DUF3078 domain-containing protein [Hufsiella ginkgonis]|uniref:DUF3078 domain-containing protein n=1 Tax=Hufsiella ginkgonis TaxID=2695274 RepID=A0A7K1XUY2_9SPHI|nr:DUF3078 domain-containing protein [Hufsiella ginkgonis]MXV14780.1 DUF3078 domain-containing protein [Hufsiella ginkgonis]